MNKLIQNVCELVQKYESVCKFIIIGGSATLIHALVANVLHYGLQWPEELDNALGYATGFFCSYFGHLKWTFAKTATLEQSNKRSFPKFAVMTMGTFGLNQLVFFVCLSWMGLPFNGALFAGMFFAAVCSYFLNRFWVFK
ncbi:MAG: GtrA family protein [Akkermansia sp.]